MPSSTEIVGSWFPTGYYGHFRSKSRPDFLCEYRQLARPQPPQRFINRSLQHCSKHVFSIHDNKQCFLNDAVVFEQGLGRRQVPNKCYSFKPDFYTWMPLKEEIERSRPLESTYKLDFARNGKTQVWTKRPKTSFEDQPGITTYRYAHGLAAPNREEILQRNMPALKLAVQERAQRAKSAAPPSRETVASCLSWYRPPVPKATPTTDFSNNMSQVQHVPTPPAVPPPSQPAAVPSQPAASPPATAPSVTEG